MKLVWVLAFQAAVVLGQSRGVHPEDPAWRQIGDGLSKTPTQVWALVADPVDRSTLYAVGDRGLLFKSSDGSETWRGLSGITGISTLLIDPKNPATLYAGTAQGILKSTDGGSTWRGANAGMAEGWPAWAQVRGIDPTNPSILYAQKWQDLYKSVDGGQTWTALHARFYRSFQGRPVQATNYQPTKLVFDPAHPQTLYAGPGLFKSTDGGTTWHEVPISDGNSSSPGLLGVDPQTSTLYAGYEDPDHKIRIFKSQDQGGTWTRADRGFPSAIYTQFVFGPNAGSIYAPYVDARTQDLSHDLGLMKSSDGGESWTPIPGAISGLSVNAFVVGKDATIHASYAYTPGDVFKLTDGGMNWRRSKSGPAIFDLPALAADGGQPNILYAAAGPNGVLSSADQGATWTKLATFKFQSVSFGKEMNPAPVLSLGLGSDNSTIYTWATCSVERSLDRGANWTNAGPEPNCLGTGAFLTVDPQDPRTAYLAQTYIAQGDGWLLKTTDGGLTWNRIWWSDSVYLLALAINPSAPGTIYAGTTAGLLKSTDGGTTWNHTDMNAGISSLAIDPVHPNTLYAGTTIDYYGSPSAFAGLLRSDDGGASWSPRNSGLETLTGTRAAISALAIDPINPLILYAGTSGNGIFRSTDGGGKWSELNRGLTNFDVRALAIAGGDPRLLYVSTTGGLFAARLGRSGVR